MTTRAVLSSVLLAFMLPLLPTGTDAAIETSDAKFGLYWVRNSSICAAVTNTGHNSTLDDPSKPPDTRAMFGNATRLPLSDCRRHRDFVIVQEGSYALFSKTDVVASLIARNYSLTFCVNTEHRVHFSCYKNGTRYFVAPTDYERVHIRGPVGFYNCPQMFEALYGEHLSLVRDEHQCATFLTVSSYGVRTHSGDCVHLFRYAQFKEYPQVWNGCQRYAEAGIGNTSYDCQFGAVAEPWNYPTREEVSRCAEYAPRVECSSLQFDSRADARYFSAGRGVRDMTQNKIDNETCQSLRFDYLTGSSESIGWLSGSHYTRTAAFGGVGAVLLAVVVFALRVMCRAYLCDSSCRREPLLLAAARHDSMPSPAEPTGAPPAKPTNGSNSTVFKPSNASSGVVMGQMRSLFPVGRTRSDVPYERLNAV